MVKYKRFFACFCQSPYLSHLILFFFRLLFCEILQTTKAYMKDLTVIQPEILLEAAPHFFERTSIESV